MATNYQQNAAHDGLSASSGPKPPLTVAWSQPLAGALSYPVIADDRVFVIEGNPGSETPDGVLHAYDRRTGRPLWARPIGAREANLAYGDRRLYLVDTSGVAAAFDPATGAPLWALAGRGTISHSDGEIAYANGRVLTQFTGVGHTAVALDGETGELLWYQSLPDRGGAFPAADSTRVYMCPFGMDRLDLGAIWWNQTANACPGGITRIPSLHAGRLYDPAGARVLDAATGNPVGMLPAGATTPAFKGDRTYLIVNGQLQARGGDTVVWTYGNGLIGSPVIAGDTLFTRSTTQLFAVDLATGAQTWSGPRASSAYAGDAMPLGLAVSEGTLVVPGQGALTAYRSASAPPETGEHAALTPAPIDLGPPDAVPGATRTYQVDKAHSGFLNVPDPAPPLKVRWSLDLDRLRYPLIAGGRIFIVGGPYTTSRLFALDEATGATLWSQPVGRVALPAYDAGRVFVAGRGGIEAFDAATGQRAWSIGTDAGFAPPVAVDGSLYVNFGGSIARFRQSDGTQLWYSPTNNGASPAAPALDATHAYGVNACHSNYAVSLATGQQTWNSGVSCGGGGMTPVLSAGRLLTHESRAGYTVDAETGELFEAFSASVPPAVRGNLVITAVGEFVHAYEFPTWRPRWTFKATRYIAAPPLVVGAYAYVVTGSGRVHALDIHTGAAVWSATTDTTGYDYPDDTEPVGIAAGDGLLAVPSMSRLVVFERAT
jgi:outer membrane protein assembly factor BamB